jgi:hypothetical protein
MFYLGGQINLFIAPIIEPDSMVEILRLKRLHGNIGKAIDRRAQHRAAVILKMIGKVGPAAEKTHPHRGAGDDHDILTWKCGGGRHNVIKYQPI